MGRISTLRTALLTGVLVALVGAVLACPAYGQSQEASGTVLVGLDQNSIEALVTALEGLSVESTVTSLPSVVASDTVPVRLVGWADTSVGEFNVLSLVVGLALGLATYGLIARLWGARRV